MAEDGSKYCRPVGRGVENGNEICGDGCDLYLQSKCSCVLTLFVSIALHVCAVDELA